MNNHTFYIGFLSQRWKYFIFHEMCKISLTPAPPGGQTKWWILGRGQNQRLCPKVMSLEQPYVISSDRSIGSESP